MSTLTRSALTACIDHTLLKPEASADQVDRLCDDCVEYGFYCACVNPVWVERCARRLNGTGVRVAGVAGFPLGATFSEAKALEARRCIENGASEIDMVVHVADLIAQDKAAVVRDIAAVVEATQRSRADALVKVILETTALTDAQIMLGCRCAAEAQADFVKTSTGFHPTGGATVEHVALMRKCAAPLKVKASGGIRDLRTALAMLEAGASRLGMSASVAICRELPVGQ